MTATNRPYKLPPIGPGPKAEQVRREYDELREQGDVARIEFPFGGDGWLTLGYDTTRAMYSDPRFGVEKMLELDDYPRMRQIEKGNTPSFVAYDGERHLTKRMVIMRHLTVKRALAMKPLIEQIVGESLDEFERSGSPANITEPFSKMVPLKTICSLVGAPPIVDPEFARAVGILGNNSAKTVEEAMAAQSVIASFFRELYDEKKANPGDDLLSALIRDTDVGSWTETELSGIGQLLLFAGHESTATTLNSMLELLSYRTDVFQRLRNEPEIFPRALEELFRTVVLGPGVPRARIALEDVEIGGVLVKEGESIGGSLVAANNDPTVYPAPEEFDLDRESPKPHVQFGFGPHACVGSQVARMEITVALKAILARYENFRNVQPVEGWKERRNLKGGTDALVVEWQHA